jgi:hypothetical protein
MRQANEIGRGSIEAQLHAMGYYEAGAPTPAEKKLPSWVVPAAVVLLLLSSKGGGQ